MRIPHVSLLSGICLLTSLGEASAQCQQEADLNFTNATETLTTGDYLNAALLFEKSASIEKTCPQPRLSDLAMELYNAASCYKYLGKDDNAIPLYKESIAINRQLSLLDDMAKSTQELSEILVEKERPQEALVLAKALNEEIIAKKVDHLQFLSLGLLLKTSLACRLQDSFDNYAAQGQKIPQSADSASTDNQAYFFDQVAAFYSMKYHLDSAALYLEKAKTNYTKCNNTGGYSGCCVQLAEVYEKLGRGGKARENYKAALDYFAAAGEVENQASALSSIATLDLEQGKTQQAFQGYTAALQLNKQTNDMAGEAATRVNLGNVYKTDGNYAAAIGQFHDALQLYIQASMPASCALVMNNMGSIYIQQGEFDKAISVFQQLLAEPQVIVRPQLQAQVLNNIGGVYMSWGQYDKAMEQYNKAYEQAQKSAEKRDLVLILNNIGGVYQKIGDSQKALEKFQAAVDVCTQTGNTSMVPGLMNNIGNIYLQRGQTREALEVLQKALTVARDRGDISKAATLSDNIGSIFMQQKSYPEAEKCISSALTMRRGMNEKAFVASSLNNLAVLNFEQGKTTVAIECLNESVQILEDLRATATGDARRDFLASQIQAYQNLIVAYIKNNQTDKAFYINELSKSKSLAEQLSGNMQYKIPSTDKVRAMVDSGSVFLGISTIDNPSVSLFTVTRNEGVRTTLLPKEQLTRMLLADVKVRSYVVANLSIDEISRLRQFISSEVGTAIDPFLSRKIFENSVKAYVCLLNSKVYADVVNARLIARIYYTYFIAPFEPVLASKKKLVVMPDGVLGLIPFETLIDASGRYLVERFDISYVHSFSVLDAIREREYPSNRQPVLAMGVFDYKGLVPESDLFTGDISTLKAQIYSDIEAGRPLSRYYSLLGYSRLNDLQAGRDELAAIKQAFPAATIVPDSLVTEETMARQSSSGELSGYRIIHISSHGLTIPEVPEMSALVLNLKKSGERSDQFLRTSEISHLKLQADLVNLSACETGVGKIYSGEGIVGLSQSFLVAGANGLSVSLWQVDEESTTEFMKRFYGLLQANNFDYVATINQVKRAFIKQEAGVAWSLPYSWASFVYYGKR